MITDRFKLAAWKLRLIQIYMLCAVSHARCWSSQWKMLHEPGQILGVGYSECWKVLKHFILDVDTFHRSSWEIFLINSFKLPWVDWISYKWGVSNLCLSTDVHEDNLGRELQSGFLILSKVNVFDVVKYKTCRIGRSKGNYLKWPVPRHVSWHCRNF